MTIVDNVMSGAKQEVQIVKSFIQSPKGPFETVDSMVRTARNVVFNSLKDVGVNRPVIGSVGSMIPKLGGQMTGKLGSKIRSRIRSRY